MSHPKPSWQASQWRSGVIVMSSSSTLRIISSGGKVSYSVCLSEISSERVAIRSMMGDWRVIHQVMKVIQQAGAIQIEEVQEQEAERSSDVSCKVHPRATRRSVRNEHDGQADKDRYRAGTT